MRMNKIGCTLGSFQIATDSTAKKAIAGRLNTEDRLCKPSHSSVWSREAANTSSMAPKISPADAGRTT